MVRNTYPHYLEDASRQRANMGLNLQTALTRLEEICREKFDVRMEELIFPEKIWLINETNLLSRFMTWGEEAGMTMINLDEFESELLANESTVHLFKTGKLVSFIRQFNLYDFKKKSDVFVDVDGNGNQLRYGLYYHSFVRMDRQDLLQQCVRKVVKRVTLNGSVHSKRSDMDSDSENYVQPRKRRGSNSPASLKLDGMDSNDIFGEASPEPLNPRAQITRKMLSIMPRELPVHGWSTPLPAPPLVSSARPTSMRLRSSAPSLSKENAVVLTKQQKDAQRVFWVKRWLEMPEEWRHFPEVGEKQFCEVWMEDYTWNLDPMVVGELAALANCGEAQNVHVSLTDDELTKWMQELDVAALPDLWNDPTHTLMVL